MGFDDVTLAWEKEEGGERLSEPDGSVWQDGCRLMQCKCQGQA